MQLRWHALNMIGAVHTFKLSGGLEGAIEERGYNADWTAGIYRNYNCLMFGVLQAKPSASGWQLEAIMTVRQNGQVLRSLVAMDYQGVMDWQPQALRQFNWAYFAAGQKALSALEVQLLAMAS